MLTEKTLGKIELLESYLAENYASDKVVTTILNGVIADLSEQHKEIVINKIPSKQQVVKHKEVDPPRYPEKIDLSTVTRGNFQKLVDKKLEVKKFENSIVLIKATYDKTTKELTVHEKGGAILQYPNIPVAMKDRLFSNGRAGKYYNAFIKRDYNSKNITQLAN